MSAALPARVADRRVDLQERDLHGVTWNARGTSRCRMTYLYRTTADRGNRLVVFAPNWLGDAVMALPAIADVRRAPAGGHARGRGASVGGAAFELVPVSTEVVTLESRWTDDARALRDGAFDDGAAVPQLVSQSALVAWRAGIPERWGYRTDLRRPLLTRASRARRAASIRPRTTSTSCMSLGFDNGPHEPRISRAAVRALTPARDLLAARGWDGRRRSSRLLQARRLAAPSSGRPSSFAPLASTRWRTTACSRDRRRPAADRRAHRPCRGADGERRVETCPVINLDRPRPTCRRSPACWCTAARS